MEKQGYFETNRRFGLEGIHVIVYAGRLLYNGLHWHDDVEIMYCKQGWIRMVIDGEVTRLQAGEFVIVRSGAPHEVESSEDCLQILCFINGDVFGNKVGMDFDLICRKETETAQGEDCRKVKSVLGRMAELVHGSNIYPPYLQIDYSSEEAVQLLFRYLALQYELLSILAAHRRPASPEERKHRNLLTDCVYYINEHLGEELTAASLGKCMHVSEPTIYRAFKEQMGFPLGDYVTRVRLDAACRFLLQGDAKVIDIAYACGFTGLSNFYRVFKKYMGVSPAEYRKAHHKERDRILTMEPDIMKLNRFLHFSMLGIPAEVLAAADGDEDR